MALTSRFPLKIICIALLASFAGCGTTVVKAPPPEAVLAGTWSVVFDPPGYNESLVFDENGHVTERIIQFGSGVGSTTVTQTNIHKSTSVDGAAVHIELVDTGTLLPGGSTVPDCPLFQTCTVVFDGSINDALNVISGRFSIQSTSANMTTSTDQGGATLTKQ
ncbi:MAG TPA: hypothetical protein VMV81_10175 [Phycisphaerae bacterium]|nr:hypothetical protein [Phycisphaerae bacterium]